MRGLLFFIAFLCFWSSSVAQKKVFFGGFFPEIAISHPVTKKLKGTFKIESQHIQFDDRLVEGSRWEYEHYRTDFQGFLGGKLNPFWKVAVGYQFRWEGSGPNHHRAIQQITFLQKLRGLRVGHRLRLDQTFFNTGKKALYRTRYRLGIEIPLAGQSLDPGELYLIASDEVIHALSEGESEIEHRLSIALGCYFGPKAKLQLGPDWRTDRFIAPGFRHRLWLKAGCFLNL